jgi:hypothetical protein
LAHELDEPGDESNQLPTLALLAASNS